MQFSILTLAAFTLLPQALALPGGENFAIPTVAPNQLPPDMTPRGDFNEADVFAITAPAGCSIISCAQVLSEAVCIANALDDDNWKKIFKCAKVKQLCNCASCFKSLGTFLKKHGLC